MTSQAYIAPWAEVVPGAGPVTADDLLTRPDDGWQYEVVDGVLPPRLKPPSQVVGPLLRFMDEGDDFERAVGDAIGGDMGRVGDNQFTRAVYAARAPALRVQRELLDGLCDTITDQAGIARTVTGDMAH
jgi:hypothetical protein